MAEKKPNLRQINKQNRKPHARCVNKPNSVKDVRINLRRAKFRPTHRQNSSDSDSSESERYSIAPQPKASWLPCDDIPDFEEEGKDFENLLNVSVSAEGHFSFKGEKDWNFDSPQSSELFSLDLRHLNAAVSCIPFNERIGLDDTYFSKDQLTYMRSAAEEAKQNYLKIAKELSISKTKTADESTKHKSDSHFNNKIASNFKKNVEQKLEKKDAQASENENLEDDLDFLLTLKEPLTSRSTIPNVASSSKIEESKCKSATVPTKSIDLEKWLDSVLDI